MSKKVKKEFHADVNDEKAVRKNLSREFDHELANEPLTEAEKHHNKKTKKRQ